MDSDLTLLLPWGVSAPASQSWSPCLRRTLRRTGLRNPEDLPRSVVPCARYMPLRPNGPLYVHKPNSPNPLGRYLSGDTSRLPFRVPFILARHHPLRTVSVAEECCRSGFIRFSRCSCGRSNPQLEPSPTLPPIFKLLHREIRKRWFPPYSHSLWNQTVGQVRLYTFPRCSP